MSLKNTECIYGIAVYTGHETKILMNAANQRYKKSSLESFTDKSVQWLFVIQLFATFVLGCIAWFPISAQWTKHTYLYLMDADHTEATPGFGTVFKIMCTWILLFVNLVPISLMISLDLAKLIQGKFMQYDTLMYDKDEVLPMKCQASNLNEELG
jgi:magnesium-transporting ATPase (P-type)